MRTNRLVLAALALAALPLMAAAQTYKCTDARGKVRYSGDPGPGCKVVPGTAPRAAPAPKTGAKAPAKGTSKASAKAPAVLTAQERARRASDCKTMQEQLDWLTGPRGEGVENRAARIGQVKQGLRDCP
jgi:hypothetical protein